MINATLVTIHGFGSSPATWERLNMVWQSETELRGLKIHSFGYPSPKKPRIPFSGTRVPDYDDIAQIFASEYTTALANQDLVIVTHSQGGLILQRFLAWMVSQGRAQELRRIRSVVILACPNGGSEYLESLRRTLGYGRHPQASNLQVLNRQVADTQRVVLQRIVNASTVDNHQCHIPFHVYAGGSDDIVKAASAQASFPDASTIIGNHFTILDPAIPGNRTAETVKHHILTDITTPHTPSESEQPPENSKNPRQDHECKYVVNAFDAQAVQIGDANAQRNNLSGNSPEERSVEPHQSEELPPDSPYPRNSLEGEHVPDQDSDPEADTGVASTLAKRFREEWAKDITSFTRIKGEPTFEEASAAFRRGAELGMISRNGVRAELAEGYVFLRVPHKDDWPSYSAIPLHVEARWLEHILTHEWTPDQSFVDMLITLAAKLRSTPYWTGEKSYSPDSAFTDLGDLLLYGVEQIRNGNDGVINRLFQAVGDDWLITEWQIIDKSHHYQILFRRFSETDWISHVTDKTWVDDNNFIEAFGTAQMLIYSQIFDGRLPEGWSPPNIWPFKTMFGDSTLFF